MEGLSQANSARLEKIQSQGQVQQPQTAVEKPIEKKDNSKKIALALAGLAALGIVGIGIAKHKIDFSNARKFFDNAVQELSGNNKIISETAGESKEAAEKFITEHQDFYSKLQQRISEMIQPKALSEISEDGCIYHGADIKTAKAILHDGITPYASAQRRNAVPGLGRGVYTTPSAELAQFYSKNSIGQEGIILPYKVSGQIGELKEGISLEDFTQRVFTEVCEELEPAQADSRTFFRFVSPETQKRAEGITADIVNRTMQDLGYSGLYSKEGMTKGILSSLSNPPEGIDTMGQLAIYNGENLTLDLEKLRELNPITKENFRRFL